LWILVHKQDLFRLFQQTEYHPVLLPSHHNPGLTKDKKKGSKMQAIFLIKSKKGQIYPVADPAAKKILALKKIYS